MDFWLAEIRINMSHSYRLVKANNQEEAFKKLSKAYGDGVQITVQRTIE